MTMHHYERDGNASPPLGLSKILKDFKLLHTHYCRFKTPFLTKIKAIDLLVKSNVKKTRGFCS
jgi:hypothetical protein